MKETKTGRRKGPSARLNILVFMAAALIFALVAFQVGQQIAANVETQQAAVIQLSSPEPTAVTTIASAASSAPPTSTPLATGSVTQAAAATNATPAATATQTAASTTQAATATATA